MGGKRHTQTSGMTAPSSLPCSLRVAVVCDFLEEKWYSMDLLAYLLLTSLQQYGDTQLTAAGVRPAMRRRFSMLPVLGGGRIARNADRLINRFSDYPRYLRSQRAMFDLFHIVDHSYAHLVNTLLPLRTVVTCHDVDAFRCILDTERDRRSVLLRAMARRTLDGLQRAARVVCVSHATRDELLAHRLVSPERIRVVRNCVHPAYSPEEDPGGRALVDSLLGPAEPDQPELLHVGSTIPRKRIDVLLRVFAEVRKWNRRVRLIHVGGPLTPSQQELASRLGLTADAVFVAPVLDLPPLAAVYRRAALLLQPSDREGFGLPIAESMACGTPALASDIPALREAGGSAASYCPVADCAAWSRSVIGLLEERAAQPESWNVRRLRCLAQARQFNPAAYAEAMVSIYNELDGN
jgi:glycosyltransferase involved in cell wall biosynthesis